jgi:hypothetical protein
MKLKAAVTCGVVVALAVPAIASADAGDKVTGGGQILVGTSGAGSTIAFTAQDRGGDISGQAQWIDRSAGTGQAQQKFHGVVDCLYVNGTYAELGGLRKKTDGTGDGNRFVIRVQDNGNGAGKDMIEFDNKSGNFACGDDDDDEASLTLGRGNAQVRDASGSSSQKRTMSYGFAVKLARL